MDKRYIVSRYRADRQRDIEFNLKVARYFCQQTVLEDKIPVAPHIYYTQFLDDAFEDDRSKGIELGLKALQECQEALVIVIDGVISQGMRREMEEIYRLEMPYEIVSMSTQQAKERIKVVR